MPTKMFWWLIHSHTNREHISGGLCQKQVSKARTRNYTMRCLWNVITCPCFWYVLLAPHSWYKIPCIYVTRSSIVITRQIVGSYYFTWPASIWGCTIIRRTACGHSLREHLIVSCQAHIEKAIPETETYNYVDTRINSTQHSINPTQLNLIQLLLVRCGHVDMGTNLIQTTIGTKAKNDISETDMRYKLYTDSYSIKRELSWTHLSLESM